MYTSQRTFLKTFVLFNVTTISLSFLKHILIEEWSKHFNKPISLLLDHPQFKKNPETLWKDSREPIRNHEKINKKIKYLNKE